jgi:prepilin-type N-terminal cleavage/methylation domain-containing protein
MSGWGNAKGFGLAELMAVLAIVGIVSVLGAPTLVNYWHASTLQAGAEELAMVVSRGRQLAIAQNNTVCVQVTGTSVRHLVGGCSGTVWTGAGTSSAGVITLTSSLQVSGGTSAIFTSLGGASTTATYTVTHPTTGKTRSVAVLSSGRVSVQ